MSQICEMCGKKPQSGRSVSHSHRRTLRRFMPNLTTQKIYSESSKTPVKKKICTRCLRTLSKKPS